MKRRKKSSSASGSGVLLLILGGVLLVAAAIAIVLTSRPGQVESPLNTDQPATSQEIERVSLADAKSAFDVGEAVFLDVRSKAEFDVAHIPGAVSIPLNELPARMAGLEAQEWIITYCT